MKREVASRIATQDRTDASLDVLRCLKVRYLVGTLHLRGIKRKDPVFVNSSAI